MNSSAESHHQKDSKRPPPSYQPFDQTSAAGNPVSDPQWYTGLCDCCQDFGTCCLTCWCPCITFGRIVEILERGSTSCVTSGSVYTLIALVTGCACLYSCCYRTKLRGQYHLHGNQCTDCLTHCFCETCALCQEYRELKHRGFDMEIGWHANVEQKTRGVTTLPPNVTGGMSR